MRIYYVSGKKLLAFVKLKYWIVLLRSIIFTHKTFFLPVDGNGYLLIDVFKLTVGVPKLFMHNS